MTASRRQDDVSTGIGATLREAREAQGRSLEDAALSLRARVTQLEALEEERFGSFGGEVYAKGFLKSYAAELGLDPAPLLETYRREVSHDELDGPMLVGGGMSAPKPRRSTPPPWIAWVLVAVVVVAGIGFLSGIGGGRAPEVASPEDQVREQPPSPVEEDDPEDGDEADGTSSSSDEAEDDAGGSPDDADDEADAVERDDADEQQEAPSGLDLLLALEERSWMRVVVDGSVVFEGTVPAGETQQYPAEDEIEIRYGNPGGVRAELNGEDLGPQGSRGEPVTVLYTPDGVEAA